MAQITTENGLQVAVQHLLDMNEIREISVKYNRYADAADGNAFASLWIEDGEFDIVGDKVYRGHDEIAFACRAAKEVLHFVVDSQIQIDGDRATQKSKLLLYHLALDRQSLDFACTTTLTDEFVRVNGGGWKIKYRRSEIDMAKEVAFRKMNLIR